MRARAVEPEHGRRARRPRALDREPHPVADRRVLGLARAPDVAGLDLVLDQRVARAVDDPHAAVGGDLERLVVAAVLLGLLRHQADVRRRAHRRRVERAVLAAEVDRLGVQRGVRVVRDDGLRVLLVALGVPQLARRADHRRHRRVDDHVARHVQVRDPAVGVHHREVRRGLERLLDRGPDRVALVLRQLVERRQDRAEAVVRARAELLQRVVVLGEDAGEERPDGVPEDDRVRDLHHRRLQVQGEQQALLLGVGDLLLQERVERPGAHHRAVDDLALEHRDRALQHGRRAVGGDVLDPQLVVGVHRHAERSVERKSPSLIVATCERLSFDHAPIECGCFCGVGLHRRRRAPVRVALAQHRVDRAALHAVVGLARRLRVVVRGSSG